MQFFWTWKRFPELQQRSGKEFRQAIWQVGLKPYGHWQVWVALLATSILMLLGLETLLAVADRVDADDGLRMALLSCCVLIVIFGSRLVFRHVHLSKLRPYISQVSFDPTGSWWVAFLKSTTFSLIPFILIVLGIFSVDWVFNCFDQKPDPRIEAIKAWPEPIPDNENGAIASIGLMGPVEITPFETGRQFVAVHNESVRNHTQESHKPDALKYVEYVERPMSKSAPVPPGKNEKTGKPKTRSVFCAADKQSCWNILRQEPKEVSDWLAANKLLLARYESLKKYPRWQHAMLISFDSPIPAYVQLIHGQALLQAVAMRDMQMGNAAQGLQLLGEDIVFVRRMLASKDTLVGKMFANAMLYKDFSLLSETLEEFPVIAKKHASAVQQMVMPLTTTEISISDAMRFETQKKLSLFEGNTLMNLYSLNSDSERDWKENYYVELWMQHHLKSNATINMFVRNLDWNENLLKTSDTKFAKPISAEECYDNSFDPFRWYYNQVGEFIHMLGQPAYNEYANRMYDLNALNNLVRLQLTLDAKGLSIGDVPAYLSTSDRTLWNPETAQPFQWDAQLKQVYFLPATERFKKNDKLGGVLPGRVGFQVN